MLAISRVGVGIGEGATQPAANSILFDSLPKSRRGIAMGGLGVGLAMGLGLSMALGGIVAEWWDLRYPDGTVAPLGFSGWQFAFLVASLPGFPLAWLIYKLREPERGAMDGITSKKDPAPFRASAGVLGAVTPGSNWYFLWRRDAGGRQWLTNLGGLAVIMPSAGHGAGDREISLPARRSISAASRSIRMSCNGAWWASAPSWCSTCSRASS